MADDVSRVTPEELNRRMQSDGVVVLDVRRGSYAASDVKIKGAMRIEPDRIDQEYGRIPPVSTVVTYCT